MEMEVGSYLTITEPNQEIKSWCSRNLILANPEYQKKVRMGFWVGNTPKELRLFAIRGNKWILPYGCLNNILPAFNRGVTMTFKTPEKVNYNANIPLYDYQEIAVNEMLKAQYGILQAPAGSGKTQMGLALAFRLKAKTLWLTHTKDLLTQSRKRALEFIDKSLVGTITEGRVKVGTGITFATVQTMSRLDLDQYRDEWDCIIVDECHRVSGTPTSVTMFSKVLNMLRARHKYGLSATVHRADGLIKATKALLGQVAHIVSDKDVDTRVMRVTVKPIATDIGLSDRCLNPDGTLNPSKLTDYLTDNTARNESILVTLIQNKQYSSLILSNRLSHLSYLIDHLPPDMKQDAVMISGKMTSKTAKVAREQAVEDMRKGRKKYLFASYTLAKEGLDIPRLERLYLTVPVKDYAVVTQSIGRVARKYKGKAEPVAFDFVDNFKYAIRAYKKRCESYRKAGCFIGE